MPICTTIQSYHALIHSSTVLFDGSRQNARHWAGWAGSFTRVPSVAMPLAERSVALVKLGGLSRPPIFGWLQTIVIYM